MEQSRGAPARATSWLPAARDTRTLGTLLGSKHT